MGEECKSPKVTQVMRFLNLCASLGCDGLIFGMFCIITSVELFCTLKSVVGLAGICVQLHSFLFSNKINLVSRIFLVERKRSVNVGITL